MASSQRISLAPFLMASRVPAQAPVPLPSAITSPTPPVDLSGRNEDGEGQHGVAGDQEHLGGAALHQVEPASHYQAGDEEKPHRHLYETPIEPDCEESRCALPKGPSRGSTLLSQPNRGLEQHRERHSDQHHGKGCANRFGRDPNGEPRSQSRYRRVWG